VLGGYGADRMVGVSENTSLLSSVSQGEISLLSKI
jgi:hypothetical protein